MTQLDETIETFGFLDPEMRLEMLLDFSERLPPLPEAYRAARDAGLNRVPECQSPVFLWIEHEDGRTHLVADAPPEAPTVRGFVNLLREAVDGAPTRDVADLPLDLLSRLGLAQTLGMMRTQGLTAITHRIRRSAREALAGRNGAAE